ncbi:MAG: hypothetical protein QX196_16360 [Methylococcaceae bacterium]|jgi:hypothetical protein
MKTTDAYRERLLTELIEHSAQIDALVIESRQAGTNVDTKLEALRAKQQITTKKLHQLEDSDINVWENIGDGG